MTQYDPRMTPLNGIRAPENATAKKHKPKTSPQQSFENVLQEQFKGQEELKFSQHAKTRLNSSGVNLGPEQIGKLEDAVAKARSKAAGETLVLMNDTAFVVSVKNNTVITVVDGERMKENVFTNIDSAVIT